MSPTTLKDLELSERLKRQVISLATALYGTYFLNLSKAFDVVTYTTPTPPQPGSSSFTEKPTYGIALIAYTSPPSFTSWEVLSYINNLEDVNAGMEKLLRDLQAGMDSVMQDRRKKRTFKIQHLSIPDLAARESEQAQTPAPRYEEAAWTLAP